MTAEKQYVDEFESAYQGKTWSKGKIFGILLVVFIGLVVRDIGMSFIYGSIYDKFAEEGLDATISFVNYVYMVLLYALPMVLPMILRFTNGAYDNEIESPLLPSFNNKVVSVLMYVVIGLVSVVPVVLFVVGMFTTAYMFVSFNLALLIFTSVVTFYYLGTYILQRARVPLAKKHSLPTVFMVVTSVPAMIVSIGVIVILYFTGVNTSLITHLLEFIKDWNLLEYIIKDWNLLEFIKYWNWNLIEFILKAVGMFGIIAFSTLVGGLLYTYTQNIIYSATPVFLFANASVIIMQRLKETADFFKSVFDYEAKIAATTDEKQLNSLNSKLTELKANMPEEIVGTVLGYLLIALVVAVLVFIAIYAITGLAKVRKAAK